MKLVIVILLLAVIASLASALFFLTRDREGSPRTLKALKIRVALSALLILVLLLSYYHGLIVPGPGVR